MKLKYYLRGLGIGIIVTTLILMIAGAGQKEELTDAQVIERAKELGMVMENSGSTLSDEMDSESEQADESETALESTENASAPDEAASVGQEGQTPEDDAAPEQTDNVGQEPYKLAVNAGEVCRQVCDELQENGLIDNSENFRKYLSQAGYANQIQPGNFEIAYGLSYEEIAQILITRQQ